MTKRIVAFELGTNDGQGGFKELLSVNFYTVGETETLSHARDRFIKIDQEVYRGYADGDDPSASSVITSLLFATKNLQHIIPMKGWFSFVLRIASFTLKLRLLMRRLLPLRIA